MEEKTEVFATLERSYLELKQLELSDQEWLPIVVKHIATAGDCFRQLKSLGVSTHEEQIINYCLTKLGHAKQLAESFDREESVIFTQSIISYLIKSLTTEEDSDS